MDNGIMVEDIIEREQFKLSDIVASYINPIVLNRLYIGYRTLGGEISIFHPNVVTYENSSKRYSNQQSIYCGFLYLENFYKAGWKIFAEEEFFFMPEEVHFKHPILENFTDMNRKFAFESCIKAAAKKNKIMVNTSQRLLVKKLRAGE